MDTPQENGQVSSGSLERTNSNSSTGGSSDGSSNIECHFTKNVMKESLESIVPAAPSLFIGLCSSASSSETSSFSSKSDSPSVKSGISSSGSSSGFSNEENDTCSFIPLTPKTSAYESADTLTTNSILNSRNCLPLLIAMDNLNERPEIKRVRKSEVRFENDLIIHDSLTDRVINVSEECMNIGERTQDAMTRRMKQSLFDSDLIDWDILKPGTSGLQRNFRSSTSSAHVTDSDFGPTDTSSSEEDKNLRQTTLYRINK